MYHLMDRTHPSYSSDRAVLLAAFKKEYPQNNLSENISSDGTKSVIKAPEVGKLESELGFFEEPPFELVNDPSWAVPDEEQLGVESNAR